MTTTSSSPGHVFSKDYQAEGWYSYLNNGEYSPKQQDALVAALMAATKEEFDALLPAGAVWLPTTSEIQYTVGMEKDLPDSMEAIVGLLEQANEAVVARFEAIETEALK